MLSALNVVYIQLLFMLKDIQIKPQIPVTQNHNLVVHDLQSDSCQI